jgi:hypothetical protein
MSLNPDIKNKMKNSEILKLIDFDTIDKKTSKQLNRISHLKQRTNKLKVLDTFFNSTAWTTIHGQPDAYIVAFELLQETFGLNNCAIVNAGISTNGSVFWDTLNVNQKNFINNIDTNKKIGIYKFQGLIVRYIVGSTTVGSFTDDPSVWSYIPAWPPANPTDPPVWSYIPGWSPYLGWV